MLAMFSLHRIFLGLKKYTRAGAPNLRTVMSTGLLGRQGFPIDDARRHADPKLASTYDRTWKRSYGIAFEPSKPPTRSLSPGPQAVENETFLMNASAPQDYEQQSKKHTGEGQALSFVREEITREGDSVEAADHSQHLVTAPDYPNLELISTRYDYDSDREAIGESHAPDPPSLQEPFYTPHGFHIPIEKLEKARENSEYWHYGLYQGPEGGKDKVKVHYCKNTVDTERVAQLFLEEDVIGFDIEWEANARSCDDIKKNLALIQIASERRIALFHLARYPNATRSDDFIAPSFKKVMESPEITKVGVAIKADCTRLRTHLQIDSRGLFELSHLHKLVKFLHEDVKKINRMTVTLAEQVQEHLQLPLWKGDVRCGDWSQELNHEQTRYAASDPYAGLQVFYVLEAKRKMMNPMPPRPAHAETNLPISLTDDLIIPTAMEPTKVFETSTNNYDATDGISIAELTRDLSKIAIDGSPSDGNSHSVSDARSQSVVPPRASHLAQESVSLPPSPELSRANEWVSCYKSSIAQGASRPPSAKPAELRAYALWHDQGLDVDTIAGLLRKPPLQKVTVANYVGKAIQSEGLPYEAERIGDLEKYGSPYRAANVNWPKLKQGWK